MKSVVRFTLITGACTAAAAAVAHPGHGVGALAAGLSHLFTPEHLLPLLAAVGLLVAGVLTATVLWRTPEGDTRSVLRTWRWIAGAGSVGLLAAVLALPGLI